MWWSETVKSERITPRTPLCTVINVTEASEQLVRH